MGLGGSKDLNLPAQQESQIKIKHEKFVNREFIKDTEGEELIKINVSVPSQKQYIKWKDQLIKYADNEALLLPKQHSFKTAGFCGSAGSVEIVYQNYPFILSDQIGNRESLSAKYFQENELWYLAFTIISAAQNFHANGQKIGDIRPLNIFISDDGSVKIACIHSWPLEKYNYEKSFQKQITYISPEQVIDLGYGKTQSSTDFELAETFSIGLTLLDAALLSDSSDLYKNFKQIDYDKLQKRLAELNQRNYSDTLVHLIYNMCEVNPQNRTKVTELFEWLNPYEQSINSFNPFQVVSLPHKFSNKPSTFQNKSDYSNIYNPKPYTSSYNPPPTHIQSNPPQTSLNEVGYSTALPSSKPIQFGSNYPIGAYNIPSLPQVQPYTSQPFLPGRIQIQSTYVPFKSNFSLQKIDQQLEQSRKMFPS